MQSDRRCEKVLKDLHCVKVGMLRNAMREGNYNGKPKHANISAKECAGSLLAAVVRSHPLLDTCSSLARRKMLVRSMAKFFAVVHPTRKMFWVCVDIV